jgi:hypothetical protein
MSFLRRLSFAALTGIAAPALLTAQGRGGEPPKNLQVLPKDMPRQQVTAIMGTFTAALGVRCEHCHVESTAPAAAPPGGGRGGPAQLDFAADGKPQKAVAREMLKMVADINAKYLPTATNPAAGDRVTCETCHHGLTKPATLRGALAGAVAAKGTDSAVALYRDLRTKYYGAAAYDFSEGALPSAANEVARANQRPAALALLKLNLEYYDKSALTYQTMAQLVLQGGDTAAAIDALKKATTLQPNNPQVRQMLQRLGVNP